MPLTTCSAIGGILAGNANTCGNGIANVPCQCCCFEITSQSRADEIENLLSISPKWYTTTTTTDAAKQLHVP